MSQTRTGYLDPLAHKYPYLLHQSQERLSTFADIKAKMASYGQNAFDVQNGSIVDNFRLLEVPSPWGKMGKISLVADTGIAIATDDFLSKSSVVKLADMHTNRYSITAHPKKQALYVHLRNDSYDVGTQYNLTKYTNGVAVECQFTDNQCQYAWFFSKNQVAYFCFNANYSAKFGYFGEDTAVFTPIGELLPNQLCMLTSSPCIATGTVKDSLGNPMADCRIAAFHRNSFALAGTATSDKNGVYEMPIMALAGDSVFMVCLDNDNAPDFEAIIYDRIQIQQIHL